MTDAATTTPKKPGSPLHVGLLVAAGCFLVQLAWIAAIRPLSGFDEYEHVYKATATAGGQLLPQSGQVPGRRGELMRVPADVADTVARDCTQLPLEGIYGCQPVTESGRTVLRATAAGRYHPLFYWVVGSITAGLTGIWVDIGLRLASALICAVLLGAAAWAVARWARGPWPLVGLVASLTPTFLSSTALPSPNGIEMCAAALLWCLLLGLAREGEKPDRKWLAAAAVAAAILATVRLFGPLWLLLILTTWGLVAGRERLAKLRREHFGGALLLGSAAALGVALNAGWAIASKGQPMESTGHFTDAFAWILVSTKKWLLESVSFTWRLDGAGAWHGTQPWWVYVVYLLAAGLVIGAGWVVGTARTRVALLAILVLSYAVAVAATLRTFEHAGIAWQGRYSIAYGMGLLLVSTAALDRSAAPALGHRSWRLLVLVAFALAQVVSIWSISHDWRSYGHLYPTQVPALGCALVALVGMGLLTVACTRWERAVSSP